VLGVLRTSCADLGRCEVVSVLVWGASAIPPVIGGGVTGLTTAPACKAGLIETGGLSVLAERFAAGNPAIGVELIDRILPGWATFPDGETDGVGPARFCSVLCDGIVRSVDRTLPPFSLGLRVCMGAALPIDVTFAADDSAGIPLPVGRRTLLSSAFARVVDRSGAFGICGRKTANSVPFLSRRSDRIVRRASLAGMSRISTFRISDRVKRAMLSRPTPSLMTVLFEPDT